MPARGHRSPRARPTPILVLIGLCALLSIFSAVLLPTVPSYDPWAWIVWGRELVDPHLSFATGGGPSWKPLPVLFTTVFGLFGGAAPTLWVITARAAGLLGLCAAWRLASRLASSAVGSRRAAKVGEGADAGQAETIAGAARITGAIAGSARTVGTIAGLVAVLGVILTQDFAYYMFRGASEPMLVAASLWAIDRLLAGRHGSAFVLGVGASLIQPVAWPFLGIYAVWLWIRQPRLRLLILAGIAAIPIGWFVPPWIASGQPFLAATHARAYNGHLGNQPVLEALRRSADVQVLPVLILATLAVVLTCWRERDRVTLALTAGALAWIAVVVGMVIDGYPGLERFFLPASAVLCVLAGVGVARVAALAGSRVARASRRAAGHAPAARMATLGVAVALIAVSIPLSASRIDTARAQKPLADRALRVLDQLSAAVRAVGGHREVFPCRSSFSAVNHAVQTALAWKLHVTLARVGTSLRKPGVDFLGPHDSIDGGAAPVSPRLTGMEPLAQTGVWRVIRVTRPGHSTACVGR